jgi:lipoprotein-releasing system permease protein
VLTIVAMALTLSFAATLYPSWRAARTDPVEVLRGE